VEQQWWWCLRHQAVEPADGCANRNRLGPFATVEEAAGALQTVQGRNARYDREDSAWEGDDPS
jgi:hypothetical protein